MLFHFLRLLRAPENLVGGAFPPFPHHYESPVGIAVGWGLCGAAQLPQRAQVAVVRARAQRPDDHQDAREPAVPVVRLFDVRHHVRHLLPMLVDVTHQARALGDAHRVDAPIANAEETRRGRTGAGTGHHGRAAIARPGLCEHRAALRRYRRKRCKVARFAAATSVHRCVLDRGGASA